MHPSHFTSSPPAPAEKSGARTQRAFLPPLFAVTTLLFCLLATFGLWYNARASADRATALEFESQVREISNQIGQRMGTYEQILRGARGFLNSMPRAGREQFHVYVDNLDLGRHFPGIQAIGVAEVVAPGGLEAHNEAIRAEGFPSYRLWPIMPRERYTAITRIEPFNRMNQRAFGFDMFSEAVRRTAMEQARDSGAPALSGKVILVQEDPNSSQPGVLMYLPLYRGGGVPASLEQRREALLGWVYAPFRINDFLAGLGGERSGDLAISLYDGDVVQEESCLYGCGAQAQPHVLSAVRHLVIADRPWTLDMRSTPAFEARMRSDTPWLIGGGGLVTSLLLSALVWALSSGRGRAVALATRMTQALRASNERIAAEQQRIRVILENSHDAFVAVDAEGKVTDWNLQAERTFGWSAAEAIGRRLDDLIIPADQRTVFQAGFAGVPAQAAEPVSKRRIELTAQDRTGRQVPVEMGIAVLHGESGDLANAFIRDLSELRETERREAQRQQALEEARARLQSAQRMEAVGKLTGGVAHDFNNVLQIISGNIQLLMHGVGEAHREKRLASMMEAVERGASLSSRLLAFARRQPLQPRAVNLRRLLADMDELLQRAVGAEIAVETVQSARVWNAMVDPSQLENVILNLAINARDAMPEGQGCITIEAGNVELDDDYVRSLPDVSPGQYVMLAVSDTGSGMPREVLEHAFEPFFTTKPEGQGTGLGLSMAYGFVKQSGGHIRLYSEVGHGTTVRLYLPRAFEREEALPRPPADDAIAGGSESILVVEDDPHVQATVVATLRELGYQVLQAHDGASALAMLQAGTRVDLIFTDVVMPGPVRSTEMVSEARKLLPEAGVLFTSGYTQNAIVHAGRLDPGVHLLSKPYRREQLARKVREVLDARPARIPRRDQVRTS
ncbi:PAS domain S-box-containing protein [Noviherbaspirillum humi]|uniref:histidine kinase n=1 Tax=Noviherbaspirillum humi TaxID=1688639 RepID=A0A239K2W7_9BURK|nr:CHASE domain-containing protein [Noviherbaspirillum humi]SNT12391.1 PAS domain S-box-containing protein [Noviherbaspirillum humi]